MEIFELIHITDLINYSRNFSSGVPTSQSKRKCPSDDSVPTLPTRLVEGPDARLTLGGAVFEFRHRGGGHTPGDMMVLLPQALAVRPDWLAGLPGRTLAAIELVLIDGDITDPAAVAQAAQRAQVIGKAVPLWVR